MMDHSEHEHHHHEGAACTHCETSDDKIVFGKRLKLFSALFVAVYALSFIPALSTLNESFNSYLGLIWWAVLLGLFIGGLIDYFVPDGFIYKFLGGKGSLKLVNAVVAGFLLSACSHGILAIAIQLYKKGAGIPSVITLLLASPWANIPVTILLFSFFGAQAWLFIGGAVLIALVTGLIFTMLESVGLIEKSLKPENPEELSWDRVKNFDAKDSMKGVARGSVNLANMVLWWIIIGFLAAVLIRAYVPAHIFLDYFGPGIMGLFLTLLFATIIEVCSEGSAPIAFEIFNKVGVLGNPFVFLMAGVVTDYTEIGLIWTNIGKRTAIWLPIITVPQVMLLGWLFNAL